MPIYEYKCLECEEKFALLQSFYPAESDTFCPKCSSNKIKKVISSFSCGAGDKSDYSAPPPSFGGGGG
jgi:putative FmdB family regulatory protein